MAKYNLNLMHNYYTLETIKTGTLEEIDYFIYKNNIKNVDELFDLLNKYGQYDGISGDITFIITSPQENVKDRSVLFKNEIEMVMQKPDKIKYNIFKRLLKDINFRNKFINEFLIPRQNVENKMGKKIRRFLDINNYFYYKMNELEKYSSKRNNLYDDYYAAFCDAFNSIAFKKNNNIAVRKNNNISYSELEELSVMRLPNYSEIRKMIVFTLMYDNKLPVSFIYKEHIDEFEELRIHDQNPDEDNIRLPYDDETEDIMVKKYVKTKKKELKNDYIQISMFDKK